MIDFTKNIPILATVKISSDLVSFNSSYWFNSMEVVLSVPYPSSNEDVAQYVVDMLDTLEPVPVDNTSGYEKFIDEAKDHLTRVVSQVLTGRGEDVHYQKHSAKGNLVLECSVTYSHAKDMPE